MYNLSKNPYKRYYKGMGPLNHTESDFNDNFKAPKLHIFDRNEGHIPHEVYKERKRVKKAILEGRATLTRLFKEAVIRIFIAISIILLATIGLLSLIMLFKTT